MAMASIQNDSFMFDTVFAKAILKILFFSDSLWFAKQTQITQWLWMFKWKQFTQLLVMLVKLSNGSVKFSFSHLSQNKTEINLEANAF